MRLPLKLAYPALPGDADEIRTTVALIRHAVNQKYPQGLPRMELRLWGKIEDLFDTGESEIELTPSQWGFVYDAVQHANWPVPWTKLVIVFLDAMGLAEREA